MNKAAWISVAETNIGTVRKVNEDHYLQAPDATVWCVADGMGGHARGDVASQMITQQLQRLISQCESAPLVPQIISCIQSVNNHLVTLSKVHNKIIGSTVAVLLFENQKAHCIWAGDSRIYRLRNKQIQRITRDHSQVEDMIDEGLIKPEEAESHPNSNIITRAVGASSELELEIRSYELELSDKFILCSDGLNNVLSDDELEQYLLTTPLNELTATLIETALARQARDNITVLVVENQNIEGDQQTSQHALLLDMTLPLPY
jgi:protein phosphatase